MNEAERKLCLGIARDKDFLNAFEDAASPYHTITKKVQNGFAEKQLPEPWNGHLSSAKIMFISSNPSFDKDESFPNEHWSDNDICDFFHNRFRRQGTPGHTRYWQYLRKWTNWINARLQPDQEVDYLFKDLDEHIVSTEIVHAKSKGQKGVPQCIEIEFDKWMSRIISLFNGSVIVVVGGKAGEYLQKIKDIAKQHNNKIRVIQISHSGEWKKGLTDAKRRQEIDEQFDRTR